MPDSGVHRAGWAPASLKLAIQWVKEDKSPKSLQPKAAAQVSVLSKADESQALAEGWN